MSLKKLTTFLYQRYLWVFGGFVIVLITVIVAILNTKNAGQINLLSNVFLICLVLLPMIICSAGFYLVILMGMYGVRRLELKSKRTMGGLQDVAKKMNQETLATAEKLNRSSIGLGSRFTALERIFKRSDGKTDEPTE
jgi:hypothetical protein